ncbi:MAG: type IV pilin N-terminal domain-containing protein [Candidatus Thermoplasmatota archaeon]
MIKTPKLSNNIAVSEVLGTVLLLGISTIVVSGVYIAILSAEPQIDDAKHVDIRGKIEKNNLILEHAGGESLPVESKIVLTNESGSTKQIVVDDYIDDKGPKDSEWEIDEKVNYELSDDYFNRYENLSVSIIDPNSNSVIVDTYFREEE